MTDQDTGFGWVSKQREADLYFFQYSATAQFLNKRLEQKLTQAELAGLAHTTQKQISRFEVGAINPTLKFIRKLGAALQCFVQIELIPFSKR